MSRKTQIGDIQDFLNRKEHVLLSEHYVNNKIKLDILCNKGHKYKMSWNGLTHGYGCPKCATTKRRKSVDEIKDYIEEFGYFVVSGLNKYKRARSPLVFKCPFGHVYKSHWDGFKDGNRCPECARQALLKYGVGVIKSHLSEDGYVLLSENAEGVNNKIKVRCPEGHVYDVLYHNYLAGRRCRKCNTIKQRHSYAFVRDYVESYGYKLLSGNYERATDHILLQCVEGHTYKVKFGNFKTGYRCPVCALINKTGPNNCNWKGGISKEPYCVDWTDMLKEYIRQRDKEICLNPYCFKTDKVLAVHHVDYNKQNCHPSNLITVCRSCNSRANKDRAWHTAWYQSILRIRYNYVY